MKLYHGSPKKLKVLVPKKARGIIKFQDQKAIFLCRSFKQASLYAIGKKLKKKVPFAISSDKIMIVKNKDNKTKLPSKGYVYEVNINARKGPMGEYEFVYKNQSRNSNVMKLN